MLHSYSSIKKFVVRKVGEETFDDMLAYLKEHQPSLWGTIQPPSFLERNMVLTLYKDLQHHGYQRVLAEVDFGDFPLADKSFQKNAHRIRAVLANWAKTKIELGSPRAWKQAARHVPRPGKLVDVLLWMDSVDFPKEYHHGWSKKDADFSYKLDRLGRRYMFVRDGLGRVRRIWGGYSPKLYDGHFIELLGEYIDKELAGANIIADQHFEYGNQYLNECYIWTPPKEPSIGKRDNEGEGLYKLSKEQASFKRQHQTLRARVENVFGLLSRKFVCLREPWADSDKQLDHVVMIAAAIYNNNL